MVLEAAVEETVAEEAVAEEPVIEEAAGDGPQAEAPVNTNTSLQGEYFEKLRDL